MQGRGQEAFQGAASIRYIGKIPSLTTEPRVQGGTRRRYVLSTCSGQAPVSLPAWLRVKMVIEVWLASRLPQTMLQELGTC